ncbi:MAG: glycosyltransferase [Caldilineaceae bacterium]
MSDTGGGHRASAEALKAGFQQAYAAQIQIEIIDLLMEHLPWPLNWPPRAYSFIVNEAAWLWKLLWLSGNHPEIVHRLAMGVARLGEHSITQLFRAYEPDLIISVHPLVQEFVIRALAHMRRRIPFVTVVTDLATAHPLWFHSAVDACYVASQEAYQRARQAGIRPERIHSYGLPIRPAFAVPTRTKSVLRTQLKMDHDLPAALVVSGGEGVGPIEEIAEQVAAQLLEQGRPVGQMVIICGRNVSLRQQMAARAWPIPTLIHGFVQNMPEWMGACDCIITKAGPGTIAEALISGLPIILSGFIPGQEEGNIPYVVDHGVGVYCKTPVEIGALVRHWFHQNPAKLAEMRAKALALGSPQATTQIVHSIAQLLIPVRRAN